MAPRRERAVHAGVRRAGPRLAGVRRQRLPGNFPKRPLAASPDPRPFSVALDEDRVEGVLASALEVEDLDAFLAETETQSLIVVVDDDVVFERYANGWQRDSMVTSFSVAKSFVSTLVGIAIEEGAIGSLDDPITTYLPELAAARSAVRADHRPPSPADVVWPGLPGDRAGSCSTATTR